MEIQSPVFTAADISKRFGTETAVRKVSFSLLPGQKTLLIGSNGAGKSTLLRLCSGLSKPDSGAISCGDVVRARPRASQIAFLGHHLQLYGHLSVRENLELAAALAGLPRELESYLMRWELTELVAKRVVNLSKGQQYRVALARALLPSPALIFLDEPTTNLDDQSVSLLIQELRTPGLKKQPPAAVVIATHDLSRLGAWPDYALTMVRGELMQNVECSLDEQLEAYRRSNR